MQQKKTIERRRKWGFFVACVALLSMGAAAVTTDLRTATEIARRPAAAHISTTDQVRRDLAAARACPQDHVAQWLDAQSMACVREITP